MILWKFLTLKCWKFPSGGSSPQIWRDLRHIFGISSSSWSRFVLNIQLYIFISILGKLSSNSWKFMSTIQNISRLYQSSLKQFCKAQTLQSSNFWIEDAAWTWSSSIELIRRHCQCSNDIAVDAVYNCYRISRR